MSIHALSWVLRNSEETLGRRLVLIVLADHAKDDGTCAWPSVGTIAGHARLSRRAVQDALRKLEANGSIRKRGESQSGTGIYDVLFVAGGGRGFCAGCTGWCWGGADFDRGGRSYFARTVRNRQRATVKLS